MVSIVARSVWLFSCCCIDVAAFLVIGLSCCVCSVSVVLVVLFFVSCLVWHALGGHFCYFSDVQCCFWLCLLIC